MTQISLLGEGMCVIVVDRRHASRMLAWGPGVRAVAILTVALSVGANAATVSTG